MVKPNNFNFIMAVKMRLQRKGRTKSPYYHIVVADARSPRDGKFIERLGFYNPMTKPATIEIDRDKAYNWLSNGAQPTETVRAILRFKGVLLKKHLMRGVKKGAFTTEEAEVKLAEWIGAKETKIAARVKATKEEIAAFHKAVSGGTKPAPVVEETPVAQEKPAAPKVEAAAPVVEETAAVVEDTVSVADEKAEPVAEASPEVVEETPVAEEAPVEEAPVTEEPVAEAPAAEEAPAVEEAPVAELAEEAPAAEVAEEAPAAEEVVETPEAEIASEETTEASGEENEEEKEA